MLDIILEITCPFCGATHSVQVAESDYNAWLYGDKLANVAFPYLSATEREQLISQLCPKCQATVFSSEDEDEGDDILACEMKSLGGNWW